jgi:hypothetical protein
MNIRHQIPLEPYQEPFPDVQLWKGMNVEKETGRREDKETGRRGEEEKGLDQKCPLIMMKIDDVIEVLFSQ